jgi:acetyl esterase/lipase
VLLYPYTIDVDGGTAVADAVAKWGFAPAGITIDALPTTVPVLIGRAGQDAMPALLPGLDAFTAALEARGASVSVVDYAAGPHGYDLDDRGQAASIAIAKIAAHVRAKVATVPQ